jgi:predicted ATP-grasp superfamily ATP-dependent carboligase
MIRVFVYEYTCAARSASSEAGRAASLCAEGDAMLRAVLADFQAVPGVEAFTIRDCGDEEAEFRAAARGADWSLVIAPEFNQIFETRCRWVLEEGGRLLGPSLEAVRLCADKLALCSHLYVRRIQTTLSSVMTVPKPTHPNLEFIIKPRFGAGSQQTRLIHTDATGQWYDQWPDGELNLELIVQQYVRGRPASVSFLVGDGAALPLPPAEQRLSDDGRFRYLGGRIPLPPGLAERARTIASSAVAVVPGLFGYVGVDVILGDDGNDWAIEINPRLTTSYVGLRALAETNLATAMLQMAQGEAPALRWRNGSVEFTADGATNFDTPAAGR